MSICQVRYNTHTNVVGRTHPVKERRNNVGQCLFFANNRWRSPQRSWPAVCVKSHDGKLPSLLGNGQTANYANGRQRCDPVSHRLDFRSLLLAKRTSLLVVPRCLIWRWLRGKMSAIWTGDTSLSIDCKSGQHSCNSNQCEIIWHQF